MLSSQEIVDQMLDDLDKVDRSIFGTESLYTKTENDQDMDFDRECEFSEKELNFKPLNNRWANYNKNRFKYILNIF